MLLLRSSLFFLGFVISTLVYALPCVLVRVLPYPWCFAFVSSWCTFNVHWLRITCGIDYKIEGLENIPDEPCIIMSNHQSTWETLAYPSIFPMLTWVIKKELLYVPFFGWGIASVEPIALDRKQGKKAMRKLIQDGKKKLSLGRFILIFPEGTRIAYDEIKPLKSGGFVLAKQAKAKILPVAHDSGRLWSRHSFIKQPGTIQIRIGEPIEIGKQSADELREHYATWLQQQREAHKSSLANT